MRPAPIKLYPLVASEVEVANEAVTVAYGPLAGGFITNPQLAVDQGISQAKSLYIDASGAPATTYSSATTVKIEAGQSYYFPPGMTTSISVNAHDSGHKFSGLILQPPTQYPPTPQTGTFPPPGPTTLTQTIPAYLYQEYADDDDLQAFFASYNSLAQRYVNWFANVGLAVYTNPNIYGPLLDWVAQGLYGMVRPTLSSGKNRDLGPLNTYALNTLGYNVRKVLGPTNVTATTDEIFKRIMTWNFYKGDGNRFNVRWLKRRVMRFLLGDSGADVPIDQTYVVSVTFGPGAVSIRLSAGTRKLTGGALPNRFSYNTKTYDSFTTQGTPGPVPLPYETALKEAVASGALQLPFQYVFFVVTGSVPSPSMTQSSAMPMGMP